MPSPASPTHSFGGRDVGLVLAPRHTGCWSLAPCGGLVWASSETNGVEGHDCRTGEVCAGSDGDRVTV